MNNALDCALSEINEHIKSGDFEKALRDLRSFVDPVVSDWRIQCRVFGSRELDRACTQLGAAVLESLGSELDASESKSDEADYVIVGSAFYLSGGHTTLTEEYIQALEGNKVRVLVTDIDDTVDRPAITRRFSKLTCDLRFSPTGESLLDKLKWLMRELKRAGARWNFFVHNMNDYVAVAAMQRSLLQRMAIVHHADHTFTLGLFVDIDMHIDFRPIGFDHCSEKHNLSNNVLIPLAIQDHGCPDVERRFEHAGGFVTCTSGNGKFDFPYSFQFPECIPQWLAATKGTHLHIGILSPQSIEALERSLQDAGIEKSRVTVIPRVDSLWKAFLENHVDLYIDSFPSGGGMSLVEAMGAGLPIVLHHNYISRLFSNDKFTYEGTFVWQRPEELLNILRGLTAADLRNHSHRARQHYLSNHTPNILRRRLLEEMRNVRSERPAEHHYATDDLRAFLDCFATQVPDFDTVRLGNLFQIISLAEALQIGEDRFEEVIGPHVLRGTMDAYKQAYRRIKMQSEIVSTINKLHPITSRESLNYERFSRLLFNIAVASSDAQSSTNLPDGSRVLSQMKRLGKRILAHKR